ncbi:MAG: molybdopterin-dependent oxidoreductase [Defluviicoccus sp.]|nr:molybdopterin-dependent oxidoreductase [Defluviicoccus sp.]
MTRSFCRICELGCGSIVKTDGTNVTVRPDQHNPYSEGYFCVKGRWAGEVETDPDRLDAPLLRRDGRLSPVSWKEAIDTIGTKLQEIAAAHGSRSIAIFSGNSAAYSGHLSLAVRNLMNGLRTDMLFTALTVDCIARYHVAAEALNLMYAVPVPFYDRVSGILLMGSNATVSQWSPGGSTPGGARVARDLRARGGWLGVVDPVRHQVADLADDHLAIRPGTDAVFLAGLLSFVWNEGHVARDYVSRHCLGLEDVVAACGEWSLTEIASVCGLEAKDVRRVFEQVVTRPAVVLDRSGLSMAPNATVAAGLALAVNASLGRLDVEDGLFIPDYSPVRGKAIPGRPDGVRYGREWPSALLAEAILGTDVRRMPAELPRVKALIVVGGNPALTLPNSGRVAEALSALDLLVVVDIYPTHTTRFAHTVFPGSSHYQRADFNMLSAGLTPERYRIWTEAALPLRGDQREELWIADRLVSAFNGADFDEEPEGFRDALANWGEAEPGWTGGAVTEKRCGRYLDEGFPTPSGQMEFHRPWTAGIRDALRSACATTPGDRGVLALAGRRLSHAVNSFLHNIPEASARGNPAIVSPGDARVLDMRPGDRVRLQGPGGSTEATLLVSKRVPNGSIVLAHGWGGELSEELSQSRRASEANANALTSDADIDPYCGMPVLQNHLVRIAKAAG